MENMSRTYQLNCYISDPALELSWRKLISKYQSLLFAN